MIHSSWLTMEQCNPDCHHYNLQMPQKKTIAPQCPPSLTSDQKASARSSWLGEIQEHSKLLEVLARMGRWFHPAHGLPATCSSWPPNLSGGCCLRWRSKQLAPAPKTQSLEGLAWQRHSFEFQPITFTRQWANKSVIWSNCQCQCWMDNSHCVIKSTLFKWSNYLSIIINHYMTSHDCNWPMVH